VIDKLYKFGKLQRLFSDLFIERYYCDWSHYRIACYM